MSDWDNMDLVRAYASQRSEAVFAELVRRHINLVYSVALRFTGNPGDAEDITQAVFILLARKAATLSPATVLTGWLYETTRLTAAGFRRARARQHRREQEAGMQSELNAPENNSLWRQLAPHLESAMSSLNQRDRTLLALRFFENQTAAQTATLLGLAEAAVHKRTARALERLRRYFSRRGISSTTAILAHEMAIHSLQAAPAALIPAATAAALAHGAAAGASTLTIVKTTLKIMAWTKAKSVITVTAGLLLLAGTTTVTVHEVQRHRPQPWQVQTRFSPEFLSSIPPQVTILPTYFHQPYNGPSMTENDVPKGRAIGISLDLTNILVIAYQVPHADRLVIDTPMPTNKFDFIANLPRASYQALQNEIARQFHLRGNLRSIETNILVLKVARPRDPGLQRNTSDAPGRIEIGQQYLEFEGSDLEDIASHLEDVVKQPVINQTGLAGRFNVNLRWAPTDPDQIAALKEALLSHAGLELVAERKPVNLLMVSAEK